MFLLAAIVPPPAVLDAIAVALESARPSSAVASPAPPVRRGVIRRLSGRAAPSAEPVPEPASGFELIPADQLTLPIAAFGKLTVGDAAKVAAGLREEARQWAAPTVCFAGATVLELPSHRSLALTMNGEVDGLESLARSVIRCVQRRGYRFDRRRFAAQLPVATISDDVPPDLMLGHLNALESFQGESWTVAHVSLMKRSFDGGPTDYLEHERIPVGAV
jgi:2'-5' RNA ligase